MQATSLFGVGISEALLGVLIGGLITVVPIMFNAWLSFRGERSRQRHVERLARVNLYVRPYREALLGYMNRMGSVSTRMAGDSKSFTEYVAAYQQACALVPEEVRLVMQAAHILILNHWGGAQTRGNTTPVDLERSNEFKAVREAIHALLTASEKGPGTRASRLIAWLRSKGHALFRRKAG